MGAGPALPRPLTALQARVLGVLVEKQSTVPDSYPMSLHALVAGCNQKTARHPVFESGEADVAAALDALKAMDLVVETSGSRVVRFEHNLPRRLAVPSQAGALLAVLMLRGAQTAAELRLNAERLHRFADVSSVEAFLEELAARSPALAVRLPRAPGAREARWAHRLGGGGDEGGDRTAGPAADGAAAAGDADRGHGHGHGREDTPAAAAPAAAGLRFVLPAQRRPLHDMVVPIRWGDMDAMGHVNNTVYFRYLEIVRLDWMARSGLLLRAQGQGGVIVNAFCNFLRQLEFPGDVRVTMSVAGVGRSSFDTYHTVERTDQPGVVWAEGGAKVVWTDHAARRSVPLPGWLRARLLGEAAGEGAPAAGPLPSAAGPGDGPPQPGTTE